MLSVHSPCGHSRQGEIADFHAEAKDVLPIPGLALSRTDRLWHNVITPECGHIITGA
jgi:hypothetical protein